MMPGELGYFNHMALTWNIDGSLFFYFNGNQTHISSSFATGMAFDKPKSSTWAIGGNSIVFNAICISIWSIFNPSTHTLDGVLRTMQNY